MAPHKWQEWRQVPGVEGAAEERGKSICRLAKADLARRLTPHRHYQRSLTGAGKYEL